MFFLHFWQCILLSRNLSKFFYLFFEYSTEKKRRMADVIGFAQNIQNHWTLLKKCPCDFDFSFSFSFFLSFFLSFVFVLMFGCEKQRAMGHFCHLVSFLWLIICKELEFFRFKRSLLYHMQEAWILFNLWKVYCPFHCCLCIIKQ